MGRVILRGISASLLVTVITLLAGMFWNAAGLGGISVSTLVDIGLLLSCLIGGYRTGKESRLWFLGGIAGAGFVGVGALLLALFLPLRADGVIQIILEGAVLGLIAGAVGAGRSRGYGRPAVSRLGQRSKPWREEEDRMRWEREESGSWDEAEEDEGEDVRVRELEEDAVQPLVRPAVERSRSPESTLAWTLQARPESDRGAGDSEQQVEDGEDVWRSDSNSDSNSKKHWKVRSGRQDLSYPGRSPWWEEDVGQRK